MTTIQNELRQGVTLLIVLVALTFGCASPQKPNDEAARDEGRVPASVIEEEEMAQEEASGIQYEEQEGFEEAYADDSEVEFPYPPPTSSPPPNETQFTEETVTAEERFEQVLEPVTDSTQPLDTSLSVANPQTSLQKGRISYNRPDSLCVGEWSHLEVRITADRHESITDDLPPGQVQEYQLSIAPKMKVSLVCINDPSVLIEDPVDSVQPITDDISHWVFSIMPVTGGEKEFKILVAKGGQTVDPDLYQFDKPQVFKLKSKAYWPFTLWHTCRSNWEYILGTIILPVLAFVGKDVYQRITGSSEA